MRWTLWLGWAACLWIAAGVQAAWGSGPPGPVLLVAVMAGLWSGTSAGLVAGAAVGLCDASVSGGPVTLSMLLGMLAGLVASAFPRWYSRRHPLVGMSAAALATLLVGLLLGLAHRLPIGDVAPFALTRAGLNALWLIPIYGIVLLVSLRGSNTLPPRES